MMKIEGSASGSESGSGSIRQRHGSAYPDPYQNVMDPEHWFYIYFLRFLTVKGSKQFEHRGIMNVVNVRYWSRTMAIMVCLLFSQRY
jgi:hypothetical protein